ncbi:MAG: phosphoribosylformylglycinamidine synthase subunit PurQ [Exilispira sp.]
MAENYYFDNLPDCIKNNKKFATIIPVALLPAQYDQKADSAASCISLVSKIENIKVKTAKIYCISGNLNEIDIEKIKNYLVNPVDSYIIDLENFGNDNTENVNDFSSLDYISLKDEIKIKEDKNFNFKRIKEKLNLAMSVDDLRLIYDNYLKEDREPNFIELKILDTYWSDHCRHTTFNTELELKNNENTYLDIPAILTFNNFIKLRDKIENIGINGKFTLMELATFYARYLKKNKKLMDVEDSEENNACSIVIEDKNKVEWLIEFKNETHNHPTEIEPFGGASTCIGGCIRDPLSARAYVFGAMRVSGSADPNQDVEMTLKGKLPQRKITTFAAKGFSSYGNQIGLATGQVIELYHERYVAKRLEAGAVIGATLKKNVVRKRPQSGNIVILVGGRTGRDGIGGATGSSKDHDESSLYYASSEVQKGNPVIERKLQRFLTNPSVSRLILRCNDFGAGGVAVAVGEIAKGLNIYIDRIPLKYKGLKADEVILSESQERMAVVIDRNDLNKFIEYAKDEDLEATYIADVVDSNYVTYYYKNKIIAQISRDLLDSKGAKRYAKAIIKNYSKEKTIKYFENYNNLNSINLLKNLNISLQTGLSRMFDSTIGGLTILLPYGGKYQLSPSEGMAFALPDIYNIESGKAVLMSMGFDPYLCEIDPYLGAYYSIIESITKIVAMGADYSKARLSLQEYFGKTTSEEKWGIVTSAMLGALQAEIDLQIPAIGGKDSMSGTFKEIDVPPTLISFAVAVEDEDNIIPSNFINKNSFIYLLHVPMRENMLLEKDILIENFRFFKYLVDNKIIISSRSVRSYSVKESLIKSCLGNKIGFSFSLDSYHSNFNFGNDLSMNDSKNKYLNKYKIIEQSRYGSIIFETELNENELLEKFLNFKLKNIEENLKNKNLSNDIKFNNIENKINGKDNFEKQYISEFFERIFILGKTTDKTEFEIFEKDKDNKYQIKRYPIDELIEAANQRLEDIFPIKTEIKPLYSIEELKNLINKNYLQNNYVRDIETKKKIELSNTYISYNKKPKALILVFNGTNCEFDTSRAFAKAGAEVEIFVVKTLNKDLLNESIEQCSKKILESQIICLPGGFSMGDEPDGSGKFIAAFIRTEKIRKSIEKHLENKNLILGICNGFQALIKSGLLPYGKITENDENDPTLVQNLIGSHVSRFVYCKVLPNRSPWHILTDYDKIYFIPVSHGEGRFFASKQVCEQLFKNNQVSSIYVDENGEAAIDFPDNPNGSLFSIESIISYNGLILGKMGHSERVVEKRIKNCPQIMAEPIFKSAIKYFND